VKKVIHWFRRDLRLADNTALSQAVRRAETVIPVFVFEEALRTGPDVGAARLAFLLRSVEALRQELATLNYPLVVAHGRSEIELPKLCQQFRAEAVFCNGRYEPYARARDHRVFNALNEIRVGFEIFKDAVIWEERDLLTKAGRPYTVFGPYARAWRSRKAPDPLPRLTAAGKAARALSTAPVPVDPAQFGHPLAQSLPSPGERAALDLLRRFLAGPVFEYGQSRDYPACDGTSRLSAHLRCGTVGIRTVLAQLAAVRARASAPQQESCDVFLNELIWREFYLQILANFPHVQKGGFRPEYDALAWSDNREHFQAWCEGRTGYPIVDAAQRCLNATGWMHNRLRMIVAMFLTKDLLLHWQWGERYFMRQLVDGDMAANNGGWQWSAGTGTDAAPFFRIFNPVTQGEKFDPDGTFVRTWVPELANLPNQLVHRPWDEESSAVPAYPNRIVRHEEQRRKCLAMYATIPPRAAPRSA
jgi:deoxyribodipyrimidine photo-lyase